MGASTAAVPATTRQASGAGSPVVRSPSRVEYSLPSSHDISVSNNLSIGTISGGIYEKMITSASGLAVGILAYILLTILNGMVDRAVARLQAATNQFLDVLYQPVSA